VGGRRGPPASPPSSDHPTAPILLRRSGAGGALGASDRNRAARGRHGGVEARRRGSEGGGLHEPSDPRAPPAERPGATRARGEGARGFRADGRCYVDRTPLSGRGKAERTPPLRRRHEPPRGDRGRKRFLLRPGRPTGSLPRDRGDGAKHGEGGTHQKSNHGRWADLDGVNQGDKGGGSGVARMDAREKQCGGMDAGAH